MNIPYGKHYIDEEDIKSVNKILKSNFITQGSMVPEFEKKVSKIVKSKYAVAVNSASSALQIACHALNIQKNDIVWTVPITFAASANCALNCGAIIDFVDVNSKTINIDVDILEEKLIKSKKINKLPKVLITVHFSGQPTEQDKIWKLSKKYGFKIIEDASHSIGSSRYNELVGNCKWSDITVFSFHPVKIITSAEGGMSLTNNKKIYEKMNLYRSNGIIKDLNQFQNKIDHTWYYEQKSLGYNFRMNDIQAALGISQLNKLNKFILKRNKIANFYISNLRSEFIIHPHVLKENKSSFHLYCIRIKKIKSLSMKKKIFEKFKKKGVLLNVHYIPLHYHPVYKKLGFKKGDLINSENYYKEAVSLPIYYALKTKEQLKVINLLKSII